jgi:hypothetical protein
MIPAVVLYFSPAFVVIGLVALGFGIFTIVDMARRPTWQWQRAGSNKTLWLVLEIVCLLLFGLIAIVVALLYFVLPRPRLLAVEREGPGRGPYPGEPYGGQPYGSQPYGSQPYGSQPYGGGYPYPGSAPPDPGTDPASSSAPRYPAQERRDLPMFGWYPDPSGRHEQRYWDGTRWTDQVSDEGRQSVDPPT